MKKWLSVHRCVGLRIRASEMGTAHPTGLEQGVIGPLAGSLLWSILIPLP
jgi:hypothetical protein